VVESDTLIQVNEKPANEFAPGWLSAAKPADAG